MGTIHCPGGHSFSDVSQPNPNGWPLIHDDEVEVVLDKLVTMLSKGQTAGEIEGQVHHAIRHEHGLATFLCPTCCRLLVFNGIEPVVTFSLEVGDPTKLHQRNPE